MKPWNPETLSAAPPSAPGMPLPRELSSLANWTQPALFQALNLFLYGACAVPLATWQPWWDAMHCEHGQWGAAQHLALCVCAVAVMARASLAHVRRVAVLMGSAINQDGRSSSLTVRHNAPSQ